MKTKNLILSALLAAAGAMGGCDDPAAVEAPRAVASVEIPAAPARLLPGDSTVLQAVLRAADGSLLTGRAVSWSSADTAVAAVSASGVLRARGAGVTRITAAAEGRTAGVDVTVDPHPVAQVSVTPAPVALEVGAAVQLHAVIRAASGAVLERRAVAWSASDPRVAAVSPSGYLTAVGSGSALVSATVEGVTGQVRVTVAEAPPADSARWVIVSPNPAAVLVGSGILVSADLRGPTGGQVPGARIDAWWSQDTTIATVGSTGIVRGVAPGTTRIYARSGAAVGYTTLEVRPVPTWPAQTYRLRWDEPGSVQLPIDTADWDDPALGKVRALVYLRGATLSLNTVGGRYRQDFTADLATVEGNLYLGRTTWSEAGGVAYVWTDGSLAFAPDGGGSPAFKANVAPAGTLRVTQSVRGGPALVYTYVVSEP